LACGAAITDCRRFRSEHQSGLFVAPTRRYEWVVFVSKKCTNYTSQQDFVPRKVYCVSNVTFHAESKYAIKSFQSPTVFVQWHLLLLNFRNFNYFLQWFFFLHEQIFKNFLNTGWSHTVYRYQITSCMCSEAGSEW
jgi:hypothetical protein